MKRIIFIILLLLSQYILAQKHNLTVQINNFETTEGKVYVGVYNSKTHFLKTQYMGKIVKVTGQSVTIQFNNLPEGVYAVSLFHDANNNGTMDKNLLGVPTEDYGFSNNAKGFMGPPSFDKAKFNLKNDTKIVININ